MNTETDESSVAGLAYIDAMKGRSFSALSELHDGVSTLTFTDFPDYHNVGDSAIALGQAAFWAEAGIAVHATYSWMTIHSRVYESVYPVVIHGGGNFGGLYPQHGEHRYRLAERLRPDTLLIQEPQSIHFPTEEDVAEFQRRMAPRPNLRIAVRDTASLENVAGIAGRAYLAPDSVHMLGRIAASAPSRSAVYLFRKDDESALRTGARGESVDWAKITWPDRIARRVARTVREGAITRKTNRSTERWFLDASARVDRGVELIAPGETLVTDRLHAMLIALQMGRRVIAIDNANGKLTSYANTWFGGLAMPLQFAGDLDHARELL